MDRGSRLYKVVDNKEHEYKMNRRNRGWSEQMSYQLSRLPDISSENVWNALYTSALKAEDTIPIPTNGTAHSWLQQNKSVNFEGIKYLNPCDQWRGKFTLRTNRYSFCKLNLAYGMLMNYTKWIYRVTWQWIRRALSVFANVKVKHARDV